MNTRNPVGLGLIGLGEHARRNLLPAIAETKELRLLGVAGRDPARLVADAIAYGCRVYDSPEQLLADPDIQIVYLAVPVGLHALWAKRALEAGKHVFCEKSLTSSGPDWQTLVRLSRERDLALCEAFMFRFHPQFDCLTELLAAGAIGTLQSITARLGFPHLPAGNVRYDPELGGGALLDAGCYTVAAARLLCGPEPTAVYAALERSERTAVDTAGSALLRYPVGVHAHLEWGFGRQYRNEVELWGELGSLRVERAFSKPATLATSIIVQDSQGERREVSVPPANHFVRMLAAFSGALSNPGIRESFRREIEAQQRILFEIARLGASQAASNPLPEEPMA